jgi:hypothetical protein
VREDFGEGLVDAEEPAGGLFPAEQADTVRPSAIRIRAARNPPESRWGSLTGVKHTGGTAPPMSSVGKENLFVRFPALGGVPSRAASQKGALRAGEDG